MQYITSRGYKLPTSSTQFGKRPWYNLWNRSQWPFREILVGDILYWYETPRRAIVWKSQVRNISRFRYNSKNELREKLVEQSKDFNEEQTYFKNAPQNGYCLAYKVTPLRRMNMLKPRGMRFPQQGWLRVDEKVAMQWLRQLPTEDDVVLDPPSAKGSIIEKLQQLNTQMADISPDRVQRVILQTIRRDTELVKTLRALCEYHCQFPGCSAKIPKRDGGFYVEVAHIKPVHKGGQSILGNLIVLCPNHHKELDHGNLEILSQTVERVRGKLNGKSFDICLPRVNNNP